MFRKKPAVHVDTVQAEAERAQVRKAFEAMRAELDQTTTRADAVLERLKTRAHLSQEPKLKLVKVK